MLKEALRPRFCNWTSVAFVAYERRMHFDAFCTFWHRDMDFPFLTYALLPSAFFLRKSWNLYLKINDILDIKSADGSYKKSWIVFLVWTVAGYWGCFLFKISRVCTERKGSSYLQYVWPHASEIGSMMTPLQCGQLHGHGVIWPADTL